VGKCKKKRTKRRKYGEKKITLRSAGHSRGERNDKQNSGFNPRAIHVLDKLALGQESLRVFQSSRFVYCSISNRSHFSVPLLPATHGCGDAKRGGHSTSSHTHAVSPHKSQPPPTITLHVVQLKVLVGLFVHPRHERHSNSPSQRHFQHLSTEGEIANSQ
jgi:hypothetical protein